MNFEQLHHALTQLGSDIGKEAARELRKLSNEVTILRSIPDSMLEGPAKLVFAMKPDVDYTVDTLSEASRMAKSTVYRMVASLCDAGLVTKMKIGKGKGRPTFQYRFAQHEGEPTACSSSPSGSSAPSSSSPSFLPSSVSARGTGSRRRSLTSQSPSTTTSTASPSATRPQRAFRQSRASRQSPSVSSSPSTSDDRRVRLSVSASGFSPEKVGTYPSRKRAEAAFDTIVKNNPTIIFQPTYEEV